MHTSTRLIAGASLTAGLALTAITPAHAQVNPAYNNEPRWTVAQDDNWTTLSNLPMVDALAVPGYGWQAGFRVRVGARWDSGLAYGQPWGNIEGRAELWVDTPAGPATRLTSPALIAVHVVPAFNGQWLTRCQAHIEGWRRWDSVAAVVGSSCSAPTYSGAFSNYLPGEYSACVVARGLAFADQPGSWFTAIGCPRPAVRWA